MAYPSFFEMVKHSNGRNRIVEVCVYNLLALVLLKLNLLQPENDNYGHGYVP